MQDAYLLDTSVASMAWDGGNPGYSKARGKLSAIDNSYISICVITEAEILFGLRVSPGIDEIRQEAVKKAMAFYYTRNIDHHTAEIYANLRGRLFELYAPKNKRGRLIKKHLEDLVDPTTAKELGIQENDLWIMSVAVEYDLRFITADSKMKPIFDVAKEIYQYDQVETWDMRSFH